MGFLPTGTFTIVRKVLTAADEDKLNKIAEVLGLSKEERDKLRAALKKEKPGVRIDLISE